MKMDAARRSRRNANFRLTIGKLVARAKRVDTARREKCPSAQGNRKKDAQPRFHKQDEVILPGRRLPVKIRLPTIFAMAFNSSSQG